MRLKDITERGRKFQFETSAKVHGRLHLQPVKKLGFLPDALSGTSKRLKPEEPKHRACAPHSIGAYGVQSDAEGAAGVELVFTGQS